MKKYCVFVMSLKPKYVKRKRKKDSTFANLRILVKRFDQFERASQLPNKDQSKALGLKGNKYNRIIPDEPILHCDNLGEAYQYAYDLLKSFQKQRRRAAIHGDSGKECSVYCFQLMPNVWNDKLFRTKNDILTRTSQNESLQTFKAYYVGQTSKSVNSRYQEHIDPTNNKSSKWGEKYFMQPFNIAFQEEIIKAFELETGMYTTQLLHGESVIIEHRLTEWLREKKCGAYCA